METLPIDFLKDIAISCNFTDKQQEAFIAFYSSTASREEVAQELGISTNALSGRLTRAYENIGSRRDNNKIEELRNLLRENFLQDDNVTIGHSYVYRRIRIVKEQKLKVLDLSYYYFGELFQYISELTSLTELYLHSTNLAELPESIGNLTNLTKLDLSSNQIKQLPESIGSLTNLTRLELGDSYIKQLPESIGNLTNLTSLDLISNQLTELPESIGNLTNLTSLDLISNQLTELPKSIGNLTNLTSLDLISNQLTKLSESIGNLINLTSLDLRSNQLTELPESIGNLINLTSLDLRINQLTELPRSIIKLSSLSMSQFYDNPLESPPLEIAIQGIKAIEEYFRQLDEAGEDYIYEAKLLIVGEGGAGKTTLANKIQNSGYQLPNENDDTSTEGIDVVQWKFKLDNGKEFCINIWDFGGQEIYHSTHQFFLTKRSLYVLVADSRKEDTDFYYWLNVVELLSENSPLLIVNNEKLERKRDINEKALRGRVIASNRTLKKWEDIDFPADDKRVSQRIDRKTLWQYSR